MLTSSSPHTVIVVARVCENSRRVNGKFPSPGGNSINASARVRASTHTPPCALVIDGKRRRESAKSKRELSPQTRETTRKRREIWRASALRKYLNERGKKIICKFHWINVPCRVSKPGPPPRPAFISFRTPFRCPWL